VSKFPIIPLDRKRQKRLPCPPEAVRDDGNGIVHPVIFSAVGKRTVEAARSCRDPDDPDNARHLGNRLFVERDKLAAIDRGLLHDRIQHARQIDIDAIFQLPGRLGNQIEALDRLSDQPVVSRVLKFDPRRVRRRNMGGGGRDLRVALPSPAGQYDAALLGSQIRYVEPRAPGGSGQKHLSDLSACHSHGIEETVS